MSESSASRPLTVAIVAGGPSGEAAVSRASAAALKAGLAAAGHTPTVVELGPTLAAELRGLAPDVVFPIAHGVLGEDGALQGLLEVLGLGYVGADVRGSAVAADKPTAKAVLAAAGVPVAPELVVERGASVPVEDVVARLGTDIVVKPAGGGSALGVALLPDVTAESFTGALAAAWDCGSAALVEPLLVGAEVTCGVIEGLDDGGAPVALPPTRIVPASGAFYDYSAKYAPGGSRHVCPADLPAAVCARLQELAVRSHRAVGARDLSRTDFVVGDQMVTVLEVNTLPGFTSTSLFPEAAAVAGIEFPRLCDALVRRAWARGPRLMPVERPPLPAT